MSKNQNKQTKGTRFLPRLIALGVILAFCALVVCAWYLFFFALVPSINFLLYALITGLSFGVAMYLTAEQSRSFCAESISGMSARKAVGIGVSSGLAFVVGGIVLGVLVTQIESSAGEFSLVAFAVRVLTWTIMGTALGATFYFPLAGNLAVLFFDHYGAPSIITGGVAGCIGAITGALASTHAMEWWIRILVTLGAGAGGLVLGLVLAYQFVDLFTRLYMGGLSDTVVVPVDEAEFRDIFLNQNGKYSMPIHPPAIGGIKYIAAYRPTESAITHIARVKSIKPCKGKSSHLHTIYVRSPATTIGPIRLAPGGQVKTLEMPKFTSHVQIQKARNMDEAMGRVALTPRATDSHKRSQA